nr:MAG: putative RNA dependent RNA polymerase [Beijing sediment mito-like virus 7]
MRNNHNLNQLIIKRLMKLIFGVNDPFIIKKYITLFDKIRKDSGIQYAIKYFKAAKLHCTRFICGKPLFINKSGVAVDSSGWPKRFSFLKKYLVDNQGLRVILTLLTYTRSIIPNKEENKLIKPDYSTITNPYKGKDWTIPASFIKDWVERNNLHLDKPTYTDELHYVSTKGSPNGPATVSALWGFKYLNSHQLNWMLGLVNKEYWKSILSLRFLNLVAKPTLIFNEKKEHLYTGKLAIVNDPELKRRIIAMVDYQSQFVLKPIHEGLLDLLSNLPTDRTFTQDPFHNWSDDVENFHSLDLSAATDRFPIILQKKLLMYIYKDSHFANNWANLLANREFYSKDLDCTLRYSVGQPMGAYSSWAAFTITHHLVVNYAAHLCGLNNFNDYIILGDDIVIHNNKVASKYVTIMTRLGVDISVPKTHVSKDTYEFAKRWIKDGKEITGIPLRGILNNFKTPKIIFLELFEYLQKYRLCRYTTLDLVCLLYNRLQFGKKNKTSSQMKKILYDFNQAVRYTFGLSTKDELISYFAFKFRNSILTVPRNKWVLLRLKELMTMTLVKEVAFARLDMAYNERSFNAYFNLLIRSNKDDVIDRKNIQTVPLFSAYKTHILKLKSVFRSFSNDEISFLEAFIKVRMENFDKISYMHRNKSKYIDVVSKLWTKAFNIVGHQSPAQYVRWRAEIDRVLREAKHVRSTK